MAVAFTICVRRSVSGWLRLRRCGPLYTGKSRAVDSALAPARFSAIGWRKFFKNITRVRAMVFFSRFGYLAAVFFLVAAFIAGGVGAAYHLHRESTSVLLFLFWGPPCIYYGRTLDHPGKSSYFFGLRLEYWGYGLIAFGLLNVYLNWPSVSRDWLAVV